MSPCTAKFQYGEPIGKETLRLVRILDCKKTGTERISLLLEEHPLVDLPRYHALSYTWGPPIADEEPSVQPGLMTVSLNGCDFDVFPNLHDALQWIRSRGSVDLYWIDAICINQADTIERGIQVGIMDHIYKLASRVDIWLGSVAEEHHPTEVSRLIQTMADNTLADHEYASEATLFDGDALRKYGLEGVPEPIWDAFIAFFDRKWFNRVWVVQEIALSKDAVVLWGDDIIPWNTVALCSDFLYDSRLYEQLSEMLYDNNPTVKGVHIGSNSSGIVAIQRCRHDALTGWDGMTLDHIVGSATDVDNICSSREQSAGALLFLMLRLTTGVEASDPRDQVFGLMGILNLLLDLSGRPRTELEPDYRECATPSGVFTDTAMFILEETKNLTLLTGVPDDAVKKIENIPSWVPDFSSSGPAAFLAMRWPAGEPYFDACRSEPAHIRIVDDSVLHVKAFCIGAVSLLGEVYSELAVNGSFTQWADFLLQCDPVYEPTGQCRVEAFWRTLIADRDGSSHPAPFSLQNAFHHWIADHIVWEVHCATKKGADATDALTRFASVQALADTDVNQTVPDCQAIERYLEQLKEFETQEQVDGLFEGFRHHCQAYVNLAFETLWERRPFLSDAGYLGLGCQSLKLGDTIWVVAGCPSPLVMRKLQGSSDSDAVHYRLVGEAYMHGLMHGEAVVEDTVWEDISIK
ncbi:ankyrin and het domain protein [Colletotrichum plurivorum]|uniref:Ankyrin and het domain protein n=1 Tax=Colletotrichum plurivorum TaxID=2175906 RepID=A0A8H6JTB6_9PEZI|nr:ankyrin and het domain protein [Colletotrichum plurivorum]